MPKRASGAGYFPFQWELAPLIDTIWFAEGFGQYAAIVAMAAGEADPVAYRERLLERRFRPSLRDAPPFLRRLSLVDLSRVASTLYSRPTSALANWSSAGAVCWPRRSTSRIAADTRGARSLRDVFTWMLDGHGASGRSFAVDEFPAIVRAATGVDAQRDYAAALEPLDR